MKSNEILNLSLYCIFELIFITLSLSCPIPCGPPTPIFALGAVIGRLYGSALHSIIPNLNGYRGGYAVVGATALTACVTHTISVSVIVFELTG